MPTGSSIRANGLSAILPTRPWLWTAVKPASPLWGRTAVPGKQSNPFPETPRFGMISIIRDQKRKSAASLKAAVPAAVQSTLRRFGGRRWFAEEQSNPFPEKPRCGFAGIIRDGKRALPVVPGPLPSEGPGGHGDEPSQAQFMPVCRAIKPRIGEASGVVRTVLCPTDRRVTYRSIYRRHAFVFQNDSAIPE